MRVRLATKDDAAELLEIYRPHVEGSATSFEEELPSLEVFRERVRTFADDRPWLVAELDGRLAGYAYAGPFRARAAYRWCAETALYVAPFAQRRGVGRRLYEVLVALARLQGLRTLVGAITLPNEASARVHEAAGFVRTGTWPKSGYKQGAWRDVGVWTLELGPYDAPPKEPLPLYAVDEALLGAAGLSR